jgi:hypothetical protein
MQTNCKFCDKEFNSFTARASGVSMNNDFCSPFCEYHALNAQRTFEIALPCFHEFKQPVSKTIEQFGFKDTRDDFKAILQALAR